MAAYQPAKHLTDKLSKAKALLVLDHPFFATTLMKKQITWDESCPTMAVNARGNIYLGPAFVENLNVNQLMFGLAHECLHYMLLHPARRGHRDAGAWNIACDAVINDTLIDAKVGEFIPEGVQIPNARTMKAEDLYQKPPEGGGGGQGGKSGPGGLGNDLMDEPLSDAEASALEAEAKVDMVQARNAAKMQGKLPAGLARLVDDIINVPTPWYTILERYMTSFIKSDQSWSRPNKRHLHAGFYLPGDGRAPKMGKIVIGIDTSGSIGGPELAEFQGHLNAILEQCTPEEVIAVYCDAQVGSHESFAPDELPARFTKVTGGGGTAFGPVFNWVDENGVEPELLVYLTDGYGGCDCEPPPYPTVWLTTGSTEFPFGEVVEFKDK
jgi:predicted metal-dependent peptidase